MLDRQLDSEGCACTRRGVHGNFSAMIADDGLDDCEAEARAVLLARVIRCEEARALFRCQARPSIGDVEAHRTIVLRRSHGQGSAGGHGVERIEDKIFQRPAQKYRIRLGARKIFIEK